MMRAAAAGALIAGIPLAGGLCFEKQNMEQVQKNLSYYEQLHEQYSYISLFVLTKDAEAGEELTASMLKEHRVQSTEDLSVAQIPRKDELVGKRLKVSLTKGAALSSDVVYEGDPVADDERRVELTEVYLPKTLREDEYVDVRIVFPNGEDYLVVKHKRVFQLIRDEGGEVLAVQLRLLEEELLRYQAACVDARIYEDTRLYAVQYTGEFQTAAKEYYPVNQAVFRLLQWDPNITELFVVESEQERREILESHLRDFLLEEPEEGVSPEAEPEEKESFGETKEPLTLYTGLPEGT